ncbi:MAG: maleate cis-trans isomerase family protein [Thermoleophilaceae bacterium]
MTVGILYPGHAAERDYSLLNELLDEPLFRVVHTSIGEDAHREYALLDMGSPERLRAGARELRELGVAAAMWACTSGSFIYGWDGARRQVAELEELLGAPVSSTSLAFVRAIRALGAERVAVAATYPEDISRRFEQFLADAGLRSVRLSSGGIVTAAEVGRLGGAAVAELAGAGDHAEAEVLLVPDTAMHTIAVLPELEATAGKPVLTANQVTAWEGLRLAGREAVAAREAAAGRLGALFAGMPTG